ncbi:MAG TPA: YciI family protein [Chitinophagaceae bacterium]|nr:YciI family protein [Chitinophagaceae bacterium]
MEDFLFVFRMEIADKEVQPSPEQRQAVMKNWQDWLGAIAAKNKLVTAGSRLRSEGKVVRPKSMVTDGPYIEMKEAIGGYSIIKAESLAEATELAKDCPIFLIGGNVEVRQIVAMDDNS